MAQAREYDCGCIVHDIAGAIRFCPGLRSRSLSGREVPRPEGAESAHSKAMEKDPVRRYEVADIRP